MLAMVLASIFSGITTQKIGYYTPYAIAGSCIMSVGAGLLTTLQVDTGEGKWIGYQIIYGFGMGLCFQAPNLAAQTVLPMKDVPMGLALLFFGQLTYRCSDICLCWGECTRQSASEETLRSAWL